MIHCQTANEEKTHKQKKPGQPKKVSHKAARPTSKMVNQEGQPAQNKPNKTTTKKGRIEVLHIQPLASITVFGFPLGAQEDALEQSKCSKGLIMVFCVERHAEVSCKIRIYGTRKHCSKVYQVHGLPPFHMHCNPWCPLQFHHTSDRVPWGTNDIQQWHRQVPHVCQFVAYPDKILALAFLLQKGCPQTSHSIGQKPYPCYWTAHLLQGQVSK
jgi:hypothetical protein